VDPPPADAPGAPAGDAPAPSPAPSTAPPPPASPASPPASPSSEQSTPGAADNGKTEVITVTDSPIERELLTGRAPVSVVTRADLAASGRATLGDILQALPAQANGANAQVNAGGDGTTRINLRGLGAPRTLVLVNGRRMVNGGSGADASADITTIPLAMVRRRRDRGRGQHHHPPAVRWHRRHGADQHLAARRRHRARCQRRHRLRVGAQE
jgi:outer membrane receptor protein involved in Fe transport